MDAQNIQTIFKYLSPQCYLPFIAVNKKYQAAVDECAELTLINRVGVKMQSVKSLTSLFHRNDDIANSFTYPAFH